MEKCNTIIKRIRSVRDLRGANRIDVKFYQQGKLILFKTGASVTADEHVVYVLLEPQDTMLFESGRLVSCVLTGIYDDGTQITSNVMYTNIDGAVYNKPHDCHETYNEGIVRVQSDWEEVNPSSYAYIRNKPEVFKTEVDAELSDESENPVQNKVIKHALDNVHIDVDSELSDTSENPVQNKAVKTALDEKHPDFSDLITTENNGKVLGIQSGQIAAVNPADLFPNLDDMYF